MRVCLLEANDISVVDGLHTAYLTSKTKQNNTVGFKNGACSSIALLRSRRVVPALATERREYLTLIDHIGRQLAACERHGEKATETKMNISAPNKVDTNKHCKLIETMKQ